MVWAGRMAWFCLTSLNFGYAQAGNDKNRAAIVPAMPR